MIMVVMTTATVGAMIGRTIWVKTRHSVAPSTRAASVISVGTLFSEADRMVMQKPVHIQMPTTIRAMVLTWGVVSHETGGIPRLVTMAFSSPIWVAPVW